VRLSLAKRFNWSQILLRNRQLIDFMICLFVGFMFWIDNLRELVNKGDKGRCGLLSILLSPN
ncbi:MAG: hypothetical protein C0622_10775, partial [Desulfuromonas sp.]